MPFEYLDDLQTVAPTSSKFEYLDDAPVVPAHTSAPYDPFLPNKAQVEATIAQRENPWATAKKALTRPFTPATPFELTRAPYRAAEGAIAAPALELQAGKTDPVTLVTSALQGLTGERPAELGDPIRTTGVGGKLNPVLASAVGLGAAAPIAAGVGKGMAALGKGAVRAMDFMTPPSRTGLSETPQVLARMKPERRARFLELQGERQQQTALRQQERITTVKAMEVQRLSQERETLNRMMRQKGHEGTLQVRQVFPRLAAKQSKHYRSLIQGAKGNAERVVLSRTDVSEQLTRRFPENPDNVQSILQQIFPEGTETTAITGRAALQHIDDFASKISRSAKEGRSVYTFQDKLADDARDVLVDLLESRGVQGLTEARQFWAQWAPIRNQATRDFRPFLQTPTQTQQGANRLISVAKAKDQGNANYIAELENLLGDSLTDELRTMAQQLDANQKAKAALELKESLLRAGFRKQSLGRRSDLHRLRFEANEMADRRDVVGTTLRRAFRWMGLSFPMRR
jgi:hypothetical protein